MNDTTGNSYRTIPPQEAARLVELGGVTILDVRTAPEHKELGHIPGSILLPIDLIAVAPATLPRDGRPLLVYCEHGIRSAHAAGFLARAGFTDVYNMSSGMSRWGGPREFTPGEPFGPAGPSSWLVENSDLLPRRGAALDLACGRGRHSLLLASTGLAVTALDRDETKIAELREDAARLDLDISAGLFDLEAPGARLGDQRYDLILCVHYLHRPLFAAIVRALRPGGLLIYETFTIEQAKRGRPTNPDFLLQHGELARLVAPLAVERERDGEHEGRMVAAIAARKPAK